MTVLRRIAAAAALVLALSACTFGDGPTSPPTPEGNRPGVDGTPLPAGPTTPVPAPSGAGVGVTVAPVEAPPAQQQTLGEPAEVADSVTVVISKVEGITAAANGPGEVSGPAIAVTIDVDNATSEPLDLSAVQVNLTDAQDLPGSGMTGAPASWFTGEVAAGQQAQGVYVFTVPEGNRSPVHVEVSVNPTLPTVVFSGPVG